MRFTELLKKKTADNPGTRTPIIAFLGDRHEIIALCICFIPMHESIDFYYAIVICIAIYFFKF